jgi:elongation factor Ts
MAKKPSTQSSASRRPPKPPKKTGIGLFPGGGGGKFSAHHQTKEGAIGSYVHTGNRVGVLVELSCDTDFLARTDTFLQLLRELCLQVAAIRPRWVSRDQVPSDVAEAKRKEFEQEALKGNKPTAEAAKIAEGALENYLSEACLLEQPYIRESSGKIKVKDLLADGVAKMGEKIFVRRFVRLDLGGE